VCSSDLAETGIYDVIILDRMLPSMEGVDILKQLRKAQITTPVLFLTAKDSVPNRVEGLDAGADDYLTKPFAKDELLARLRALVRRPDNLQATNELRIGTLYLDGPNCTATINELVIKLSLTEAQLLELLMRNKGRVLTKELILDKIWGFGKDVELKNVELYIFYLRKKVPFEQAGLAIQTVRGIGYSLQEVKSV
jgi:DNA-binding response OmpR family regulator